MLLIEQIIIVLIATHLVTIASFYILKRAHSSEILRSSKKHPANMGNTALQVGGLVIVPVTSIAIFIALFLSKTIPINAQFMFAMPVIFLFIVGLVDDLKPISAPIRLAIHFANATTMTVLVFQFTQFSGLSSIIEIFGVISIGIFMVFAVSWIINTTNFIDGMDLFLVANILPGSVLLAFLYSMTGSDFVLSIVILIFLSSLLGFFWFNKPSASVYMGDAGTLCIGLVLGTCCIYVLAKYGSIAGFIPFTYILVDTTLTLLNRIKMGQNILKSHNKHAYQIAATNGKTDTSIRSICFIISILNTIIAYMCFAYNHSLIAQIMLGLSAFTISTAAFLYLRKPPLKDVLITD